MENIKNDEEWGMSHDSGFNGYEDMAFGNFFEILGKIFKTH